MTLDLVQIIFFNFGGTIYKIMKKKLSVLGIFIMLMLKYPPMPKYSLFHKIEIVQVCSLSIKQLALQFHLN
jgi:hypothetical protein